MAKPRLSYPAHRQPAHVIFGTGGVRSLADVLTDATVVFASGQPAVRAAVDASLAKRGASLAQARIVTKPSGEPTREMVEDGAAALRSHHTSVIVGLGGGSVLDWCRLSWARAAGLLDMDTGKVADDPATDRPELWLVPTTCATGAEGAATAVYADGGRKVPVVTPAFVADHVILDGQFLRDVSPAVLAAWLGDALSHAIEGFCSIVQDTLAKEAAVSALGLILTHTAAPPGPGRNERLMEAGFLGGIAAANCSVGIVHAFAHSVAHIGVPHGYANAVALAAGMAVNADTPALAALAARAGAAGVGGLIDRVRSVVAGADGGEAREALASALGTAEARADIVERMSSDVCLRTNPQPVSAERLDAFLGDVRHALA